MSLRKICRQQMRIARWRRGGLSMALYAGVVSMAAQAAAAIDEQAYRQIGGVR